MSVHHEIGIEINGHNAKIMLPDGRVVSKKIPEGMGEQDFVNHIAKVISDTFGDRLKNLEVEKVSE